MNYPKGRGWYLWNIVDPALYSGDIKQIVQRAVETGVNWVAVKIADGIFAFGNDTLIVSLIKELRAVGIDVWGWQYIYLTYYPKQEAEMGVKRMKQFDLTGFILDPEAEAEQAGVDKTRLYTTTLREGLGPLVPIGLSSWRWPSYHPGMNWSEWMEITDFHCPQVYWALATNAGAQLRQSYNELMAMKKVPFIPAGALFRQSFPTKEGPVSWQPTHEQILDFVKVMKELNLTASLWWEWANACRYDMEAWFLDVPKEDILPPKPPVVFPAWYLTAKWFVWVYPTSTAPRASNVIIFAGTKVRVLGVENGRANLEGMGWCDFAALKPAPVVPDFKPYSAKTKSGLWVLGGPANSYKAIGHLDINMVVTVTAVEGEFSKIVCGTLVGWVYSSGLMKI